MDLPRQDTGGKISRLVKGHWDQFQHRPGSHTAAIACPVCDRLFSVVNHKIDEHGCCQPSVVCPHGCGFHVMLRLIGWEPKKF